MSDKYAALRAAEPYELRFSRLWERYDEACHGNAEHMRDILELALDALETAERRIAKSDRYFLELLAERDALNEPTCWCLTCRPVTMTDMRFVVCPDCGNKRCPKANDHSNACSGSNEPGQEGSAYPAAPKQESE